ncbi:unnamed protein product [Closterium sp. NIES-54]
MALRASCVPLYVPLHAPPESSLPAFIDPSFETAAASALVGELLDFAAACRLDNTTALVAESESASLAFVEGECALGTDVLEDRQEDFECLAAAVPRFASMLLAPKGDPDALDIPTPLSYAEAITSIAAAALGASESALPCTITSSESSLRSVPDLESDLVCAASSTIFSPLLSLNLPGLTYCTSSAIPSLQPTRGDLVAPPTWLHWVISFWTTLAALGFAPSTADPSLFLRTDTTLPPFYVIVNVDDLVFATADTEALAHVKSELQKRHTCTDLGELTSYLGLRITWDRAQVTITLTQSHMVQKVLQRFGFTFSSPQSTPLPTGHSLSAPPSDESIEPSGPYPELVGCLITSGMGLVLGGLARVVLTGHADSSWVDDLATQRSSQGYTFSLGSGSELRWLTYPLADLGEAPRSPPVLYVDNKAMLALYQEHRLEHRTKHIALRYFLARELQQRGQLRLAYVASQANTADVFTKALQPCDHQRFCTVLGLVPTVPHLLTS